MLSSLQPFTPCSGRPVCATTPLYRLASSLSMTPVSSLVPWIPISVAGTQDVEASAAWGVVNVARHAAAAHATADAEACSLRIVFIPAPLKSLAAGLAAAARLVPRCQTTPGRNLRKIDSALSPAGCRGASDAKAGITAASRAGLRRVHQR